MVDDGVDDGMQEFVANLPTKWPTRKTDDGVQTLKRLTHLEELNLLRLPMTDQGLGQLATLTGLKRLRLHEAKVTGGGIAALKKAIANSGDAKVKEQAEQYLKSIEPASK